MKRRVMIAKALSHEPDILFLDEPTAGVDVELRRDMWELVRKLRADGTTIILTTHYIEEAEEMADRVGVISRGELIAVDEKKRADGEDGQEDARHHARRAARPPFRPSLPSGTLRLEDDGHVLCYEFDSHAERTGIASLMRRLTDLGIAYKDLSTHQSSLEDIFVELVHRPRSQRMNGHGIAAIYRFEMARWRRTLWQSLITPVITTALYFVVFGSALGSRMTEMDGVSFGSFIVPGLTLLSVFMQSIFNASFGIYFPKFTGTIYELLSAPISSFEAVLAYVGAAVDQVGDPGAGDARHGDSVRAGAGRSPAGDDPVPARDQRPASACSASRSACGRKNFEQLQIIPMLVITPLTFLGGAFYSVKALHEPFRTITLFNPVVHLISGFRWSFYSIADVPVWSSVAGHAGDHRRLHGGDRLDVPDRLPAQAVSSGDLAPSPWSARSKPCPSRFWATKSQLTMFDSTALANRGRSLR